MSIHRILVEVAYHNDGSNFGPGDNHICDLVQAAVTKVYADPARNDAGVLTVKTKKLAQIANEDGQPVYVEVRT